MVVVPLIFCESETVTHPPRSLFLLCSLNFFNVVLFAGSQVEEELLEQEFLERCFQEMLDEEDQDWFIPARDLPPGMGQIQQQFNGLSVNDSNSNTEEIVVSILVLASLALPRSHTHSSVRMFACADA